MIVGDGQTQQRNEWRLMTVVLVEGHSFEWPKLAVEVDGVENSSLRLQLGQQVEDSNS